MATNEEVRKSDADLKPITNAECLQTVRVLHKTIVSLRKALVRSQSEVHLLRSKVENQEARSKHNNLIEHLALENHALKRRILSNAKKTSFMDRSSNPLPNPDEEALSKSEYQERNDKVRTDSEESEDVDDIELIFTTDDTKTIDPQEKLEPISDDDCDADDPRSEAHESEYYEPTTVRTQSVLVGTDISKCGVLEDDESNMDMFLSPDELSFNPATQRHMLRAEQAKRSKGTCSAIRPTVVRSYTQTIITRPVLRDGVATSVRDSEAQTDISAVPPHWKSESFLSGAKENQNFPTLPSKFVIPSKPVNLRYPLKLMDKTQEARRILLSDISFTSMVPELSRSVDHLCQNGQRPPNAPANTMQPHFNPAAAKFLKSPALLSTSSSYSSKFEFNMANSNWNSFENSYFPDQDRSTQDLLVRRRQSWRPSMHSLEAFSASRTSSVPPSPTTRRHSAAMSSFSPASVSSDRQFYYPLPDKFNARTASNLTLKNASNSCVLRKPRPKVSFRETLFSKNSASRQSLPNIMHVDTESAEDSTESLIDESEECVRRSIDSTLTLIDWPCLGYRYVGRTYSVPNLFLEFSPPLSARPFIARTANDLRVNYFVKVINKEGRVVGGRIQFVGSVPGSNEEYVGLLLPPNLGETDGTLQGLRFFTCEKNCGLFVPFRKVVMAWKV